MSSQTYGSPETTVASTRTWGAAVAGGLVAGVGMGLIMHFVMNAMPLIGALYGQPTVAAGWLVHLFHSIVFALLFGFVIVRTPFREYGVLGIIGLGALYGIILEFVAAGVVLPVWANAVGAAELPVPFLIPIGFVTHLVYGVLLGAVFGVALARERSRAATRDREQPERPVA